ncbi:MAG: hypothetical protein K4571_13675 [Deltaproteobacteria bacterium]
MRSIVSVVMMILILTFPGYAFKPESQHQPITRKALLLYQACTGQSLAADLSEAFVEGSVAEDDLSIQRAVNWHFYNHGNTIGCYFLICRGANDKIFQKRFDGLMRLMTEKKSGDRKIYEMAGRLAHHIQDMSAPPHVMPVYHVSDDRFDRYIPVSDPAVDVDRFCKAVSAAPVAAPPELLELAAQNTLSAVSRPVAFVPARTVENETWLKFWGGPESFWLPGFKKYGEYGNVFGKAPPCDHPVCSFYNDKTYDLFFNECSLRAVADTVRVLFFLDQQRGLAR